MFDYRRGTERELAKIREGERQIPIHHGNPVARLEPIRNE
jgi:antitoxin (DNA-binding transcriptional repressor) of toxin-antitoxin stability system